MDIMSCVKFCDERKRDCGVSSSSYDVMEASVLDFNIP